MEGREKKKKGEKKRKERRKRKEMRKKRRNERKTKERRKKNTCVGKKEKMGNKGKELRFPMVRWSEVNRPRIKVGLLVASYELVQKKNKKM